MKIVQTIGKAAVCTLLVFTVLFTACQSTGGVGRNSEALRAFERAEALYKVGTYGEAAEEYTKAIELEPEWAEAFLGRGNTRFWGLDVNRELGLEDYEKAAALDPKYLEFAQAVKCYMDGDYLRAIETFNSVIQNNINLMDSYSFRGNAYFSIDEFEKAIADHSETIRLYPDFNQNYSNRAYAYNTTGQYDMAIADSDQAIRLDPDSFYGYLFRGEAYFRKENYRQALADLNRAIQLNPDNKGGLAVIPYFIRASIYFQEGSFSSAITDYSQVIQFLPDATGPYVDRGYCYLQTGDYDRAAADIDTALRLDPGNETALWVRDEIRAARARR